MAYRNVLRSLPIINPAVAACAVLAVLALGTYPVRGPLYTALAGFTARTGMAAASLDLAIDVGLMGLGAAIVVLAGWAWNRSRASFWNLLYAAVGGFTAYLTSEAVKLVATQERPCRVMDVATVLACPAAGDWSWPSNHSVVAASLAVACSMVLPGTAWFAAPVAILIALARVAGGVHYVHHAASGLALGMVMTIGMVVVLRLLAARLARRPVSPPTRVG